MTYIPPIDDTTRPWWEATKREAFLLQECNVCGHVQHPPRILCTSCASTDARMREASGQGQIDSFTVVHRSPQEGFDPPYVVARVRLAEGPVVLSNIVDREIESIVCDAEVSLSWLGLEDGRKLPVFS